MNDSDDIENETPKLVRSNIRTIGVCIVLFAIPALIAVGTLSLETNTKALGAFIWILFALFVGLWLAIKR